MRKWLRLLAICAGLVFLPGCMGQVPELSQIGVIKGAALDRAADGSLVLTVSMLNTAEDAPYVNLSAQGKTVAEARQRLRVLADREPFFDQNDLLLVSRELAEEGIMDIVNAFYDSEKKQGVEKLAIIDGSAAKALEAESGFGGIPAASIRAKAEASGAFFANIRTVKRSGEGLGGTCLVPVGRQEKGGMALDGAGILRNFALVGELTADEAEGAQWMLGSAQDMEFTFDAMGEQLTGRVLECSVNTEYKGNMFFAITARFAFAVTAQTGDMDFSGREEEIAALAAEAAKGRIMAAISRAQRERADFLNLAAVSANHDPSLLPAAQEDWGAALAQASFSIEAGAVMKYTARTGGGQ